MNKFEKEKHLLWLTFDTFSFNEITDYAKLMYEKYEGDIILIAALVTVLNHKCWYFYENNQQELSDLYSKLYYEYNDKAWDWLEKNGTEEEKH